MKSTKFIKKRKKKYLVVLIVYKYLVRECVKDKKSSGELARCRHDHSNVFPDDWFTEIGYHPPLFRLRDLSKGNTCVNLLYYWNQITCKLISNFYFKNRYFSMNLTHATVPIRFRTIFHKSAGTRYIQRVLHRVPIIRNLINTL